MGISASKLGADKKVTDIAEIGDVMLTAFGDYRRLILNDLFANLMETTPERTGTLRYNWRFNPYSKPGDFLAVNDGSPKPWPREPDDMVYDRDFSHFTIYNNSPYILIVNNGEGGNAGNQNFIQRALAMTDSKF